MLNRIVPKKQLEESRSNHQQLFIYYTLAVLVDLTVLNLFDEYWTYVTIDSFSISLLTAVLLQTLLKITLVIEHRIADFFKSKTGLKAKVMRGLSTWAVLFISKLVILEAIVLVFGEEVSFTGPIHGLVSFIVVIIAILLAEYLISKVYKSLA